MKPYPTPKKISDQLRDAADLFLYHPDMPRFYEFEDKHHCDFSCHALAQVLNLPNDYYSLRNKPEALKYLVWLGMPLDGAGFNFNDPFGPFKAQYRSGDREAQETRHTWLHFAADLWDAGIRP